MLSSRSLTAAALAVLATGLAACSSSSDSTGPATPQPVIGFSATAVSTTEIDLSWSGRQGESYRLERALGSSGAYSVIHTEPTLAADGTVEYNDTGLEPTTGYSYRVTTLVGTASSSPTTPQLATTFELGHFTADISDDITANRTLYADTTYTLKGFIHVANGATLTIEAGTTIKGDFATLGSSLWILRGARIQAIGAADNPIVLTSSRAPGTRQVGDWGGLLIIGNAVDSRSGDLIVEGSGTDGTAVVSAENYQVLYSGGTTQSDDSGTLKYVRVEFAGFGPELNAELNSYTFAAVGSGTKMSYVQAMAGLDDGFEFWGGAMDGDHMVAYEVGDDMFDMSEGYQGRLQFVIGYNSVQLPQRTGAGNLATDLEGIENDGCAGSGCDNGFDQQPYTIPIVANFTLVGCGSQSCVGASGGHGLMLRRGVGGWYVNGVVARFPQDGISLRDPETYARGGSVAVPDMATSLLQVRNIFFTETPALFQAPSATQFTLDAAANSLTLGATPIASLYTKIPAVAAVPSGPEAFDWTPVASSAITTGGMSSFTGRLLTQAGSFVTPTAYLGAVAPGGPKWWEGWTSYAQK